MDAELIDILEGRIVQLLSELESLKAANEVLESENRSLRDERAKIRARIDELLAKLEGI